MNVTVLLEELHSKSVEFTLNDGHVMVDAPDEVLTPEIESLLRQYREEIFRELQAMSDNDAGKEKDNPNQPPINPVEENTQRDSETNPSPAGALLAQAGITVRHITDSTQAAIAVAALLETKTPWDWTSKPPSWPGMRITRKRDSNPISPAFGWFSCMRAAMWFMSLMWLP